MMPEQAFYIIPKVFTRGKEAQALIQVGRAIRLSYGPVQAFSFVELFSLKGLSLGLFPIEEGRVAFSLHKIKKELDFLTSDQILNTFSLFEQQAHTSLGQESFASFSLEKPLLMGIVNVTPDSFSDGGHYDSSSRAIKKGLSLVKSGADIVDVGGESTRPGAPFVEEDEEIRRICSVIEALSGQGAVVSVDTRRAKVMEAALKAGAQIINDVSGLREPGALEVVAKAQVPVVLMHMQGQPSSMQENPSYDFASGEVFTWLKHRIETALRQGIKKENIAVDPGIGFGKTLDHNLQILRNLALFHQLGCPLLLGVSRKSLIGTLAAEKDPKKRLSGSVTLNLSALEQGVRFFRVHDVEQMRQAFLVREAL